MEINLIKEKFESVIVPIDINTRGRSPKRPSDLLPYLLAGPLSGSYFELSLTQIAIAINTIWLEHSPQGKHFNYSEACRTQPLSATYWNEAIISALILIHLIQVIIYRRGRVINKGGKGCGGLLRANVIKANIGIVVI